MTFNRRTFIRTTEALYACDYCVGGGGGEGTLAVLAPYGFSEPVGITVYETNEKVYQRILDRGEIAVTLLKSYCKGKKND